MKSCGSSTSEATSRLPLQIGGRTEGSFDRAVLGRAKRQAERCIKQGVPYQVFNKWFRDRAEGPKRASCVKYVKLVFGNELRIEKKNLSYHELEELFFIQHE